MCEAFSDLKLVETRFVEPFLLAFRKVLNEDPDFASIRASSRGDSPASVKLAVTFIKRRGKRPTPGYLYPEPAYRPQPAFSRPVRRYRRPAYPVDDVRIPQFKYGGLGSVCRPSDASRDERQEANSGLA